VYAGGRPLWHLSLCQQERRRPVPVLRWSPTVHRRIEAIRDHIFRQCGSHEPAIEPDGEEREVALVTRQWRKPLSIEEVARMAPTPEVRERRGRP
jgi:hypothetical protein